MSLVRAAIVGAIFLTATPAFAGPPYVTDDPEPTPYKEFEVYAFAAGTHTQAGNQGATGIDFNYGGFEDVQLTAALPLLYEKERGAAAIGGIGNIELAVKYRFLHQDEVGIDVTFFPRVFLPSASHRLGEQHASVLLPLWAAREWDDWSAFGGGGCVLQGGGGKTFCLGGAGLTRQILPALQIGAEIYHETADTAGGDASTGVGFGIRYDVNDTVHVIGSSGPGLEHARQTNQYSWYTAILFTF